MKEQKSQVEDQEINYKSWEGWEKNIVVLHGWGGSSDSWLSVAEILNKNWFSVFIPDLPGFWKTWLAEAYNIEKYAKIVASFIKKLWLTDYTLLGHSNGWSIAVYAINHFSLSPAQLVLNNSAWIRNDIKRVIKRIIMKPISFGLKFLSIFPFYTFLRKKVYTLIGWRDYIKSEEKPLLKETFLNVIWHDLSKELLRLKLPTLLIRWEKDTFTPLSDARKIRLLIKGSKLVILNNAPHSIHIKTPLELSNTLIENI